MWRAFACSFVVLTFRRGADGVYFFDEVGCGDVEGVGEAVEGEERGHFSASLHFREEGASDIGCGGKFLLGISLCKAKFPQSHPKSCGDVVFHGRQSIARVWEGLSVIADRMIILRNAVALQDRLQGTHLGTNIVCALNADYSASLSRFRLASDIF